MNKWQLFLILSSIYTVPNVSDYLQVIVGFFYFILFAVFAIKGE